MRPIDESDWRVGEGAIDDALVDTPLIELVETVVRRDPDAQAIAEPGRVLTYRQAWNAAVALAKEIAAATRPSDRVGVRLPAGADHGVAILACVVAARIVVLLDPTDPPGRTAEVIGNAGIEYCLGEPALLEHPIRWRKPDGLDTKGPLRPAPRCRIPPHEPAFIAATSGSSGVPKLIVHSQRSEATAIHLNSALSRLTAADRSAFTGSSSTAACLQYLFQSLVTGGLGMFCDIRTHGLNRFLDFLQEHRVTTLRIFPSLARVLASQRRARAALAHLRIAKVIGEPLLASDIAMLRGVMPADADIVNSYASTETLGFDWFAPPGEYHGGTPVPAGRIRAGASFVLLDETGAPCPPGTEGELVIRSRYNAIGEWRDGCCVPGRMIPAGQDTDLTIYRTGDLAVVGPDGMLTVLGRTDRQVKVNGNRIELGEIEEAMRGVPGIAAAAVVPRWEAGRTVLLGFFVAGPEVSPAALRRSLMARLPVTMLPAQLFRLDALPFLPGFKLDTAALLAEAARETP